MSTQAPFTLRGRNPDVLTSIANLSNDEVFTPPEFANRMLDTLQEAWAESNDGANIWADSSVTFLDPFTKSGVFLREITKRLVDGLQGEIPNLQDRVNHVLTKQVFGIGITELTSLLARRSVYCSKWANGEHSICTAFDNEHGNIWFERTEHTWVGGTEKVITMDENGDAVLKPTNGKCFFCNANQKEYDRDASLETHAYAFIHWPDLKAHLADIFGDQMRFDVIIGNPPYQLSQAGSESVGGAALPIYNKFIEAAKSLEPRFLSVVTPSRWFAGGRGLDEFRAAMLTDSRIKALVDFPDSREVFPGTQIKGGVSYFLWARDWKGQCRVETITGGSPASAPMMRSLSEWDVFVRWNDAVPILEKVEAVSEVQGYRAVSQEVSPIRPFGLRTNFRGKTTSQGMTRPITLAENGGLAYVDYSQLVKNHEWVGSWKVLLGRAYGAGDGFPHQIYNYPITLPPESACTETYLIIGQFDDEIEAKNFAIFLRTRFVRFLVSLRKNTQDIYNDRFRFVPMMPMNQVWTDSDLYSHFGITESEVDFINAMIRPMDAEV